MKVSVYTEVRNRGLEGIKIHLDKAITTEGENVSLVSISQGKSTAVEIESIFYDENGTTLIPKRFFYNHDFLLTIADGKNGIKISKEDVTEVKIKDIDKFEALKENNVVYRLYSPKSTAPRPLILFLHGGAECGTDNVLQMTGTLGALKLADSYADMYVMAPQAPGNIQEMLKDFDVFKSSFHKQVNSPNTGWHREYLGAVCDIIRSMIADKKVDANRVYVTGLSMGGAGTLRILSVGAGLFAAAAPICPTMLPDTYKILRSLTDTKLWISTAYVDHTIYRHKYITEGILHLQRAGNKNAHLTIYSPEELESYGISADPNMTLEEKLLDNHNSWILTLNNEYGIMDWLVSQQK